jgi:hypothetical protein
MISVELALMKSTSYRAGRAFESSWPDESNFLRSSKTGSGPEKQVHRLF